MIFGGFCQFQNGYTKSDFQVSGIIRKVSWRHIKQDFSSFSAHFHTILDYYHNIQSRSALNIQSNFKKIKCGKNLAKHEEKTFWDLFFTDFLADSNTTQKLKIQASVALLSQWNYCLIVKPTLKLHLNSTGTKQSSFIAPIKRISSNCIISTLFHYFIA